MHGTETVSVIADGGTRGLLWALCVALITVSGALTWVVNLYVSLRDRRDNDLEEQHKLHLAAVELLTGNHLRSIAEIQQQRVDEMRRIVEATASIKDTVELLAARRAR